jgi:hypothetical protein
MEEELTAASVGVPKIPEFLHLQEMLRKNREYEQQERDQLREHSRTHRKALQ